MLTAEEQDAFLKSAEKVRQTAERHLRACQNKQSVISFVANLQRGATHLVQTAIDQGVTIACQAGCSYCCHARVEAIPPEIFRISKELTSRSTQELNRLVQRLQIHVVTPRRLNTWSQSPECPFLENKLCAIYDVRPSACRKAHSLDVRRCQINAPEIPQDLGLAVNIEALVKGTSDAYRRLGLDATGYELGSAVLMALEDRSMESRWFDGEAVFAADVPEWEYTSNYRNPRP